MNAYIVVTGSNSVWHVVRTSDWVVIANCDSTTFANLIANSLNA